MVWLKSFLQIAKLIPQYSLLTHSDIPHLAIHNNTQTHHSYIGKAIPAQALRIPGN